MCVDEKNYTQFTKIATGFPQDSGDAFNIRCQNRIFMFQANIRHFAFFLFQYRRRNFLDQNNNFRWPFSSDDRRRTQGPPLQIFIWYCYIKFFLYPFFCSVWCYVDPFPKKVPRKTKKILFCNRSPTTAWPPVCLFCLCEDVIYIYISKWILYKKHYCVNNAREAFFWLFQGFFGEEPTSSTRLFFLTKIIQSGVGPSDVGCWFRPKQNSLEKVKKTLSCNVMTVWLSFIHEMRTYISKCIYINRIVIALITQESSSFLGYF